MKYPKLRSSDKDKKMASLIEALKYINERKVEIVMVHIKKIIDKGKPNLVDIHLDKYQFRRRWYDKNPYTWLIINALQYAPQRLLKKVKTCLAKDVKKFKEFTDGSLSEIN